MAGKPRAELGIDLGTVCLDCHAPPAMAEFYGTLLDWEQTFTEPDWVLMRNPDGGVGVSFQEDSAYRPLCLFLH